MPGMMTTAASGMEWAAHLGLPPVRALPPSLGAPCAAPPCPRYVHRDAGVPSTSTFFQPPAQERFNLLVPTSLIERNFDMNRVLQCGLKVVFKRLSRDESQPAEALEAVHGHITRHVNPIGLTSYRVAGHQPAGVGSGCSLHGWSVENGCLVVEVASRLQHMELQQRSKSQGSAQVAARRLFADCLPSPATIRKQRPRADAESSPEGLSNPQQDSTQLEVPVSPISRESSRRALAMDAAAATSPLRPLPGLVDGSADAASWGSTGGPAPSLHSAGSSEMHSSCSAPTAQVHTQQTGPARQGRRLAARAGKTNAVAVGADKQRPARHRRRPTWYDTQEAEPETVHSGIDLLLAAHLALSQQDCSRPKRARRPNTLFKQ